MKTSCVVTLLLLVACGDDTSPVDAGAADALAADVAAQDVAAQDVGERDVTLPPEDAGMAGPSVLDELPGGQWMVLSENVLEDVSPCPDGDCPYRGNSGVGAVMSAWCGGAFATGWGTLGGLVVHGGGHQDYYGSEVYVFDVGTRLWERVRDPFDGGTADCNEDGGYPDGSPCPGHTYDGFAYDPTTNSVITLNAETNNLGGSTSGNPYVFDLDTLEWSMGPRRLGAGGGTGISSAWDPTRNVLWTLPAARGTFQHFDPSSGDSGDWTGYEVSDIAIDAIASIDPVHDLYVILNTRSANELQVLDLASPSDERVTVATSGAAAEVLGASKPAIEWDPIGEQFVIWVTGTALYTLTPPTGDWRTEAWSFTRVDAAPENAVDPGEPNGNGTYSRFRYVPAKDVFIVVSQTDAPVYAVRLAR